MKSFALPATIALLTFGCATSGTEIGRTESVSSSYSSIGFGGGGKTDVALVARATKHEGKVGICAAMGENRATSYSAESVTYLKTGATFFLDGERIMAGAEFAPVYEGVKALRGKRSRCAVSDIPWKSSYDGKRVKITVKRGYIGS